MPDASTIKLLVEHYGWPGLTVAVCIFILWRIMGKHEGQMTRLVEVQNVQTAAQAAHTDVNRQIAKHLEELGGRLRDHDEEEARRHEETRRSFHERRRST